MSVQLATTDVLSSRGVPAVAPPWQRSNGGRARPLDANDVRMIAAQALAEAKDGRATESWRRRLEAIDRRARFSRTALRLFQDLQARLGVRSARPILLPINNQPFWHRTPNPFANYQSTASLPGTADVVVIGAGLTGAAAAYRRKDTGLHIVLLDQGDPAGEASGRNGGNFELLPENSGRNLRGSRTRPFRLHAAALSASAGRSPAGCQRTTSVAGARARAPQSRHPQGDHP